MFSVSLGNKAKKFLKSLDKKFKEKIDSVFETLEKNPWPAQEYDLAKIAGMEDCYRIRLGKFRINYHIDTDASEITVYRIEKKKDTTYKH